MQTGEVLVETPMYHAPKLFLAAVFQSLCGQNGNCQGLLLKRAPIHHTQNNLLL